jgi:hypothetical protein
VVQIPTAALARAKVAEEIALHAAAPVLLAARVGV